MTQLLGMNFPTPDITGLLSQSWIYVAIILAIVVIGAIVISIVIFFMVFNQWVEVYENIGGGSISVRTLRKRARKVKVGPGGEELLKIFWGPYRTAYGKKIAPRTYAFGVGRDGYWYNATMGDINTQLGILDVEPVDRDMRMMSVAVEKVIQENYNPNKNMFITVGVFLIIMIIIAAIGTWIIVGKVGDIGKNLNLAVDKLSTIADNQAKTESIQAQTTQLLITHGYPAQNLNTPAGLVPANATGA